MPDNTSCHRSTLSDRLSHSPGSTGAGWNRQSVPPQLTHVRRPWVSPLHISLMMGWWLAGGKVWRALSHFLVPCFLHNGKSELSNQRLKSPFIKAQCGGRPAESFIQLSPCFLIYKSEIVRITKFYVTVLQISFLSFFLWRPQILIFFFTTYVVDRMFVSPLNSYVEALTCPQCDSIRKCGLWEVNWCRGGHEDGTPWQD